MSLCGVWPSRVLIMGSSITLMLLHCISCLSRAKSSFAWAHLNAKIPEETRGKGNKKENKTILSQRKNTQLGFTKLGAVLVVWNFTL